jgi:GNAT superfamily N-acetyltransferase
LVVLLNEDLHRMHYELQAMYSQFNNVDDLNTVVVGYNGSEPEGCGCFKKYDNDTVEIKRMFVKPENRGQGIASSILKELESWAKELNYSAAILETGIKQHEAIGLYEKRGYKRIDNYDQYAGIPTSICMKKELTPKSQ